MGAYNKDRRRIPLYIKKRRMRVDPSFAAKEREREERAKEEREERNKYLKTYLPLYEASIRCDWKAAEDILEKKKDLELVRCKITENGETALHIAASAKAPKEKMDEFVKNLVERMTPKDLKLLNNNQSTALYLAAAAGNIESVQIMMKKNQEWMEEHREENRDFMERNWRGMKWNWEKMENNWGRMEMNRELMEKNRELIEKNRKLMEKNRELIEKNRELMQNIQDLTDKNWEFMQKNEELMKNNEKLMQKNRELELMENNLELIKENQKWMEENQKWMEENRELIENNRNLDTIPGGGGDMMPLYAAVLFGNKDVATYLYNSSKSLLHERWTNQSSTSLLLENCVESDMFDIALKIVESYPSIGWENNLLGLLAQKLEAFHENTESSIIKRTIKSAKKYPYLERSINLFGVLARKLEAFHEKKSSNTESNMIRRTVKSVSAFIGYKAGTPVKKSDALPLLRFLWGDILKKPNMEIDDILEGPPDSIKSGLGRIAQNIQLKQHFFSHLDKLEMIMNGDGTEKVSELHDLVSKYVVDMHSETQSLIKKENTTDEYQALELQKLISEFIVKLHHETKKELANPDVNDGYKPLILKNLISDHIKHIRAETEIKMHAETEIRDTYSSRVMFIAAEVGNTNFLLELIRTRPDLIWQVDDNGLSIFHVAVKHRHEGIYNLLYEIGSMKDMVTPLTDDDGNNMLHLAAIRTKKKNLEDVSGAALRMQRELLWFEEVERMIPPSSRVSKNKDGFTPRELFTMEHQHLIDQGEKWLKETASQCMVVATLIATIVFAAAFTVPGGYDQNDGIPMFKRKLSFVAFVVADALSLFLSSASILTFLSILTSRYAERDFVTALPMKLMLGLVTLFLSIGTMMVTFSVSFFVLYHKEMKWIPIFISGFAVIPAILYILLQFHLLVDVVRSTYGGKYLFKPKKQVLFYYEKPQDPQDLTHITSDPQDLTHITSGR